MTDLIQKITPSIYIIKDDDASSMINFHEERLAFIAYGISCGEDDCFQIKTTSYLKVSPTLKSTTLFKYKDLDEGQRVYEFLLELLKNQYISATGEVS